MFYYNMTILQMESNRNTKGGKGWKKRKTGRERAVPKQNIVEIDVDKGEGYYAVVKRILIGNQVEVKTSNGTIETVIIPGRMKKGRRGNWIKQDMLLLVDKFNDIIKIIKSNDRDIKKATDMMKKVTGSSAFFFDEASSDSEDDDNDDVHEIENKNISNTQDGDVLVNRNYKPCGTSRYVKNLEKESELDDVEVNIDDI